MDSIEQAVLAIISMGRARCGSGFGKYPLGVRDAVEKLLSCFDGVPDSVRKALIDFDERLAKY